MDITANVPVRIAAALLAAIALLAACADDEEQLPDETLPSETASRSVSAGDATPSPAPTVPDGTPVPAPSDWKTYTDSALGFAFTAPDGLTRSEELIDLPAKDGIPATKLRVLTFADQNGTWVVGVSEAPNPASLPLEDWIRTVPGWPCEPGAFPTCEPEEVSVGGEQGIRFSISVIGDPTATVYLAHRGSIYVLHGNIHGDGQQGPPLSEDEFKIFLERFRFGS